MGSKGVKKPKLRDLSVEPLTKEESDALWDALDLDVPPIAVAILGQVIVEHELDLSLRKRFHRKDDKTWFSMLDDRGPLSTFSRKISAAHAMNVVDDSIKANLEIIRIVRNAFAHSKRLIDFDHPLVVAELNKIAIPSFKKKQFNEIKQHNNKKFSYLMLCILLGGRIIFLRNRSAKAATRRAQKKLEASPLYRLLLPALGSSQAVSHEGSTPLALLQSQTAGPNPPAPGGLLGGMFALGEEALRKKDKK